MSPHVVSLLVALCDHGGRCCTPPMFVCEGAPEVGGHGWAMGIAVRTPCVCVQGGAGGWGRREKCRVCWKAGVGGRGTLFLRVLLKSEVLRAAGDMSALSRVWVDGS